MANPEQLKKLKQGVKIWNKWREENSGLEINLSEANLSFADLSEADFSFANLSEANLSFANLSEANLEGANLYRANLEGANFNEVHLSKANLSEANLSEANLIKANLLGANLYRANLRWAHLWEAHLNGANLSEADLRGANLSFEDLSQTDLSEADLSEAHLIKTHLLKANLRGANLRGANLREANLREANLNLVKALETNFSNATFTGACIENWNINRETKLDNIICDYIYLKRGEWNNNQPSSEFLERRPYDLKKNFQPGEFTKLFQKALETVDLIFLDGIDWKAFLLSFKELENQYGKEKISIQGIEKKSGDTLIVRVEVAPDINKAEIESNTKQLYETKLQASQGSTNDSRFAHFKI